MKHSLIEKNTRMSGKKKKFNAVKLLSDFKENPDSNISALIKKFKDCENDPHTDLPTGVKSLPSCFLMIFFVCSSCIHAS